MTCANKSIHKSNNKDQSLSSLWRKPIFLDINVYCVGGFSSSSTLYCLLLLQWSRMFFLLLSVISIVTIASISSSGFYFFFNVIYLPLSSMKLCTFCLCSILEKHHFILLLFCSLTVGRYLEIFGRVRTSESM